MLPLRPTRVFAATPLLLSVALLSPVSADEPSRVKSSTVGLGFALIPAGKFRMGMRWTPEEDRQRTGRNKPPAGVYPLHEAELDAFYISTTQVTVRQWRVFKHQTNYLTTAERAKAKYRWNRPEFKRRVSHPVTYISYHDALAFANWLSEEENAMYRLPTEAEWEYACRAGSNTEVPWGEGMPSGGDYANLVGDEDGYAHTSPVASFKANAWGLYDMVGNVWEWCADWVSDDYYRSSPPRNPTGPEHGEVRGYRGGSWCDPLANALPAIRNRQAPDRFYRNSGFRLVRETPKRRWERLTDQSLVAVAGLNHNVVIDGIRWKVTGARDLGNRLGGRGFHEPKTTPGRFIRVDIEVENLRKKPATFPSRDLFDARGRRYNTLSDAQWYFDDKTIFLLENINPNVPLRFVQVYEVASDAKGFAIGISNLRLLDRQEAVIELGF